jgi:protein-S-isoprenylcysteine O-methyltransferase Ste14
MSRARRAGRAPPAAASDARSAQLPATLPVSATHGVVAWSGVGAMLLAVTILNFRVPTPQIAYQALIVMAAAALGIFVPDLLWQKVQRRTLAAPAQGSWSRTLTKYLGLIGSVGSIALLYWLFPEYAAKGFYGNYWMALRLLLPLWAAFALPYLYWVDCRLPEPRDALWQMGRLLLFQWRDVSGPIIGQHLLGWLVKGFFLPLMFTYFCGNLDKLLHYDLKLLRGFGGYFDWAYFTLYFIDVALVSMTYLMSLKLTDTHIRSAEPTAFGWLVALVCYEPFWSLIGRQYLAYDSGPGWGFWLGGMPALYALWGSLILAMVVIYVWSTIAFGARFSNLTHRGIITNGPYRYTKHPAYLAKNFSWWLISMPFMHSASGAQTLRGCALLGMLNTIYYLRAKTEERHLARDPIYEQYAQWIDAHGILRFLNRIPLLATAARWRPHF